MQQRPVEELQGAWGYDVDSVEFVRKLREGNIMTKNQQPTDAELIEKLAALEHDQWVFWASRIQRDVLDDLSIGLLNLDKHLVKVDPAYAGSKLQKETHAILSRQAERNRRWESQWCAYARLPEETKEQDRVWAKKAFEAIKKNGSD